MNTDVPGPCRGDRRREAAYPVPPLTPSFRMPPPAFGPGQSDSAGERRRRASGRRLGAALGAPPSIAVRAALGAWLAGAVCLAVSFTSQPAFSPSTNAPLAGVLYVDTDVDSRVSVFVDDGVEVWERHFFDYETHHALPLFGFQPGRTNLIGVTVADRNRNAVAARQPALFVTGPLPGDFPAIAVDTADPSGMEPGFTLFNVDVFYGAGGSSHFYSVILDAQGRVVWYTIPPQGFEARQLADGNLFTTTATNFVEFNLLGQVVNTWNAPVQPVDEHEGVLTGHGTILYLNDALMLVTNLPTSTANPEAPLTKANVLYQSVVEISASNSAVMGSWSPIQTLDPARISYLFSEASDGLPAEGWDTEHSNAVIEDASDDSLIVSMRNQNALVKIDRATGRLKWILGPPEGWGPQWQPYLLTPVGAPFAWQYGQHAPVLTPQGTILLYDDGNFRASPFDSAVPDESNYSRAVEYLVDESSMQVSQVWSYGSANPGEWFYTGFEGNAEYEPQTGNVLIDFPAISYQDGAPASPFGSYIYSARLREVTHDDAARVVFDVALTEYENSASPAQNCTVYRAHRIPDLYPHPAAPVTDLVVALGDGVADLEFSGDDQRSFVVQSSTTLNDWTPLGAPEELQPGSGEFEFLDFPDPAAPARYYRVLTQ